MTTKRKDDELPVLILVNGLFTAALLGVDIFYSNWHGMFVDWYVGVAAIVFHLASTLAWYIVLANWQDPNFDGARKWLVALLIATLGIVAGYRASYNEHRMFEQDVEKAKMEQAP